MKTLRVFLIIVLITASLIPIVTAPNIQPEPIDSNDDAFITGAGNYFGDTPYLFLRDATTNLVVGTRFRNVAIPQGTKINNATLFVRSVYTYPAGGDISVTITGDDIDDSAAFNDSGSFSRTYTVASVSWNISLVNGDSWHNVTVTEIVQEIIDRVGWESGNDLSLLFFTGKGTPRREFTSVDGNPAYTAYIDINYGIPPPPEEEAELQGNATAPYNETDDWTWEYNDTYRGIDIWIVYQISKWLNFSTFEQHGTQDRMSGETDSFFQMTNYLGQDDTYYRRNFTDTGTGKIAVKFGITWEGLPWSGPSSYGFYGLWGLSDSHTNVDNVAEGYAFGARTWSDHALGTVWTITGNALDQNAGWFPDIWETGLPYTHWYDINLDMNRLVFLSSVYNDMEMTDLNYTNTQMFASGPTYSQGLFTYEYIYQRWYTLASPIGMTGKFLSNPSPDLDTVIFIVYPNGTLVDPDPLPEEVDPYDAIDDLLGGAQPEDPEEEDYSVLNKFQWKLLVLAVGMIMMIGSPIAGVTYGASPATWIKLLFIMFFGLGILWQIKFM